MAACLVDSSRTRDELPRRRGWGAAQNVHNCQRVCAWIKNINCICTEMAAMYEWLFVCCISLQVYVCVQCIQTNVCVPLYSAEDIDDVTRIKKIKFVYFVFCVCSILLLLCIILLRVVLCHFTRTSHSTWTVGNISVRMRPPSGVQSTTVSIYSVSDLCKVLLRKQFSVIKAVLSVCPFIWHYW